MDITAEDTAEDAGKNGDIRDVSNDSNDLKLYFGDD